VCAVDVTFPDGEPPRQWANHWNHRWPRLDILRLWGAGVTVASWYLLCQIEVLKNEARTNAPVMKSVILNLDSDEAKPVSWLESR
jgi:hypothetical protein